MTSNLNEKIKENTNGEIKQQSELDIRNKEILKSINNLSKQIENFYNKNPNHLKYLENATFNDLDKTNDRFCRFCLLRKV